LKQPPETADGVGNGKILLHPLYPSLKGGEAFALVPLPAPIGGTVAETDKSRRFGGGHRQTAFEQTQKLKAPAFVGMASMAFKLEQCVGIFSDFDNIIQTVIVSRGRLVQVP
jgi:hypothetical protein